MALSDAYATAAGYRSRIAPDRDAGADEDLQADLLAVSRYLEGRLHRVFNSDDTATARIYAVDRDRAWLEVGDLAAAPTAVVIDADLDNVWERTLLVTDYELHPLNAALGPEAWPWTTIWLTPWGTYSQFPAGSRVRVTARAGWPAVPTAVAIAVIHLTAILRLESPRATRRIPEGMDLAIETSPDAQRILRDLTMQYANPWAFV